MSNTKVNPRNNDTNFFDDKGFDFNEDRTNNNYQRNKTVSNHQKSSNNFYNNNNDQGNNFNEFNNNYSQNVNKKNTNSEIRANNEGFLIDVNNFYNKQQEQPIDTKEVLRQINFSESSNSFNNNNNNPNSEIFKHNQNILTNINIGGVTEEPNNNFVQSNSTNFYQPQNSNSNNFYVVKINNNFSLSTVTSTTITLTSDNTTFRASIDLTPLTK